MGIRQKLYIKLSLGRCICWICYHIFFELMIWLVYFVAYFGVLNDSNYMRTCYFE